MILYGVDPGGTTGLCRAEPDPAVPGGWRFTLDQFPWREAGPYLFRACEREGPGLELAVERYTITAQTLKKSRQLEALYVIGGLLLTCQLTGATMSMQSPGEAKALVTDAKLRRAGWYVPGQEHARDALRHAVYRLVLTNRLDPRVMLPCP